MKEFLAKKIFSKEIKGFLIECTVKNILINFPVHIAIGFLSSLLFKSFFVGLYSGVLVESSQLVDKGITNWKSNIFDTGIDLLGYVIGAIIYLFVF